MSSQVIKWPTLRIIQIQIKKRTQVWTTAPKCWFSRLLQSRSTCILGKLTTVMISLGRSLNVFRLDRHMIHLMEKTRMTTLSNRYLCVFRLVRHMKLRMEKTRMTTLSNRYLSVFRVVRHMKPWLEKTRMTTLSNRYLSLEAVRKTQEDVVKRIRLMTNHS